jgi:hypothetical protein
MAVTNPASMSNSFTYARLTDSSFTRTFAPAFERMSSVRESVSFMSSTWPVLHELEVELRVDESFELLRDALVDVALAVRARLRGSSRSPSRAARQDRVRDLAAAIERARVLPVDVVGARSAESSFALVM